MTEDNELIEIMARAIAKAAIGADVWGRMASPQRAMFRAQAIAALTAYRNHQVEL